MLPTLAQVCGLRTVWHLHTSIGRGLSSKGAVVVPVPRHWRRSRHSQEVPTVQRQPTGSARRKRPQTQPPPRPRHPRRPRCRRRCPRRCRRAGGRAAGRLRGPAAPPTHRVPPQRPSRWQRAARSRPWRAVCGSPAALPPSRCRGRGRGQRAAPPCEGTSKMRCRCGSPAAAAASTSHGTALYPLPTWTPKAKAPPRSPPRSCPKRPPPCAGARRFSPRSTCRGSGGCRTGPTRWPRPRCPRGPARSRRSRSPGICSSQGRS
mmetsp:Transcript_110687/g.352515  ORF Transcript_110687/g.352515 Transcript_110687/m.352515 type:complete len:262 (-) Transcript_110687:568-1353(-)